MYTRTSYEISNDNFYVNIDFNHSSPTFTLGTPTIGSNEEPQFAEYNVTKATPFVDDASKYYVSIIRFAIPLQSVPLFIMPIVPNQPNSNLTPMIIGITLNGVDYPANLIYIPDNNVSAPTQIGYDTQNITPYYYCYTYQQLLTMINIALHNVFISSGLAALFPGIAYPYFYLDNTDIIHLIIPNFFTKIVGPLSTIPQIYINEFLITYLQSFEYVFNGYSDINGKDFIFRLSSPTLLTPINVNSTLNKSCDANGIPISTLTPIYYDITQEYSSLEYWISIKKILISTWGLPIRSEFIPSANNNNSTSNASFPIIADFVPTVDTPGGSKSIAYYYPTAQYKLVDLIGNERINTVDLKIYWEDKNGNIYPITIGVGSQASIKLAFLSKKLYSKI